MDRCCFVSSLVDSNNVLATWQTLNDQPHRIRRPGTDSRSGFHPPNDRRYSRPILGHLHRPFTAFFVSTDQTIVVELLALFTAEPRDDLDILTFVSSGFLADGCCC